MEVVCNGMWESLLKTDPSLLSAHQSALAVKPGYAAGACIEEFLLEFPVKYHGTCTVLEINLLRCCTSIDGTRWAHASHRNEPVQLIMDRLCTYK